MKLFANALAAISLSIFSFTALAYDDVQRISPTVSSEAQLCYGYAMVGMDSVINARLGVPAERALDLARLTTVSAHDEHTYSVSLLSNIFNAYMWEGSPHSYAIQVFYECAQKAKPIRSASTLPSAE